MVITVSEARDYFDGTGKRFHLEAGQQEVSDSLAQRLVAENPDEIQIVGQSAPQAPQAPQTADQGQDQQPDSVLS